MEQIWKEMFQAAKAVQNHGKRTILCLSAKEKI